MKDCYTNEEVDRFCQSAEDNGKRWGAMEERERIIKLVRQHSKESSNLHYEYWSALADVISLIKGEQK